VSSKQRSDDQRPNGALSVALPSVADGWCWTTLSEISDIEGGITKDQKRRVTGGMREVPYLRVANVQRGYLDLARFTLGLQTELGFQAEKPGFTCTVCAQSESKPR
jgi:hypothetical protein